MCHSRIGDIPIGSLILLVNPPLKPTIWIHHAISSRCHDDTISSHHVPAEKAKIGKCVFARTGLAESWCFRSWTDPGGLTNKKLCILCAVASCCTLPLAILRLATKSGLMGGFMLFWLILKGSRPKLWMNSLRNCWQGVKRFGGWCVCAYVGFLLFLKSISLYQKICLSTHKKYLSNKCNKYINIFISV